MRSIRFATTPAKAKEIVWNTYIHRLYNPIIQKLSTCFHKYILINVFEINIPKAYNPPICKSNIKSLCVNQICCARFHKKFILSNSFGDISFHQKKRRDMLLTLYLFAHKKTLEIKILTPSVCIYLFCSIFIMFFNFIPVDNIPELF